MLIFQNIARMLFYMLYEKCIVCTCLYTIISIKTQTEWQKGARIKTKTTTKREERQEKRQASEKRRPAAPHV